MRPSHRSRSGYVERGFNRRREASPRATPLSEQVLRARYEFQSQTRSQSPCDQPSAAFVLNDRAVSIADAKPVPVRRYSPLTGENAMSSFNRRREASPRATVRMRPCTSRQAEFQSQTRSQSPCDEEQTHDRAPRAASVSIADAKPVPVRPRLDATQRAVARGFNRRREASPRATRPGVLSWRCPCRVSIADAKPVPVRPVKFIGPQFWHLSFNRRREASPRATGRIM